MILALDISITSTGYVIFNKQGILQGFGTIVTDNKKVIYDRLYFIEKELVKIIDEFKIQEVVVEAPAYGGRGNMSYQLFGIHFSIVRLLYNKKLPYKLLNIASIKKFATSSGRASKTQMLEALPEDVRELFISTGFMKSKGLYDITDAYFIGKKYIYDKTIK